MSCVSLASALDTYCRNWLRFFDVEPLMIGRQYHALQRVPTFIPLKTWLRNQTKSDVVLLEPRAKSPGSQRLSWTNLPIGGGYSLCPDLIMLPSYSNEHSKDNFTAANSADNDFPMPADISSTIHKDKTQGIEFLNQSILARWTVTDREYSKQR